MYSVRFTEAVGYLCCLIEYTRSGTCNSSWNFDFHTCGQNWNGI